MQNNFPLTVIVVVLSLSIISFEQSAALGCDRCSCNSTCRKVCRLVREEKKVEVTCWGCQCEEFCIPGPSKPGCEHCEKVCAFCDRDPDSATITRPKKFVWTHWIPGCAQLHSRNKLMKRTITKSVPSYKWVVENLCEQCHASLPSDETRPDAPLKLARSEPSP